MDSSASQIFIFEQDGSWIYGVILLFVALYSVSLYYTIRSLIAFKSRKHFSNLPEEASRMRRAWIRSVVFRGSLTGGLCWITWLLIQETFFSFRSIEVSNRTLVFNYLPPVSSRKIPIEEIVAVELTDNASQTAKLTIRASEERRWHSVRTEKASLEVAAKWMNAKRASR